MFVLGMVYGTLLDGRGIVRISPHPSSSSVFFWAIFFQAPFTFHCEVNKNYVNQDGKRQQKNCLKARAKQVVDYLNQRLTINLKYILIIN